VDEVTRLIVEKLLLQPTEQLKSADDVQLMTQYAEALTRLFGLDHTGSISAREKERTR
jgi:glutamyl-tRNA reductase